MPAPHLVTHAYVSTACQHDQHGVCRKACKFCGTRCLCPCHHTHLDEPFGERDRTLLDSIHAQGVTLMAAFQELSDELDAIKTAVDAVKVTGQEQKDLIALLQAQIAEGTPVSQAQLDALDAKADAILTSLTPPTTTT